MPCAIRLRPDQEEDIPRVRDALRRNRRVLLQRPTGTGKLDLVTNVALLTEGLDVPLLGVIILRPTQSLTLHLQMLGRVTRTAPGKRHGLILEHAGNSLSHGLYDFEHQWSLEGRPKKNRKALVRRCPQCGARLPIRATSCSECGFGFVVQMQAYERLGEALGHRRRKAAASG
jgi:DNA repair protein RadD